jgi:hypothetical protein
MKRFLTVALSASLLLLSSCAGLPSGKHGGAAHGDTASEHGHDAGHTQGGDEAAAMNAQAVFSFPNGKPKAGEKAVLNIRIQDETGKAVEAFDVSHEKLMHLIVVREDMAVFEHIHPEYKSQGAFTVEASFPSGGRYKLFADFVPAGAAATTIGKWIDVEGGAKLTPPQPDKTLTKTIGGKEVELSIDSLQAQTEAMLNFTLRDAATKTPIDNLEPYLGAVGHVVVISEDGERYLHVHPADEASSGPEAMFHTSFPVSGVYKIWGQFQHEGKLITITFTVKVP